MPPRLPNMSEARDAAAGAGEVSWPPALARVKTHCKGAETPHASRAAESPRLGSEAGNVAASAARNTWPPGLARVKTHWKGAETPHASQAAESPQARSEKGRPEANPPPSVTQGQLKKFPGGQSGSPRSASHDLQPVSPISRLFLDPALSTVILMVMEFHDDCAEPGLSLLGLTELVRGLFTSQPRFTSRIEHRGYWRVPTWVPADVDWAAHVVEEPSLCAACSTDGCMPRGNKGSPPQIDVAAGEPRYNTPHCSVESHVIRLQSLPCFDFSQPLWKVHLLHRCNHIPRPTAVFRIHHVIGDGTSLMSLLTARSNAVVKPSSDASLTARSHAPLEPHTSESHCGPKQQQQQQQRQQRQQQQCFVAVEPQESCFKVPLEARQHDSSQGAAGLGVRGVGAEDEGGCTEVVGAGGKVGSAEEVGGRDSRYGSCGGERDGLEAAGDTASESDVGSQVGSEMGSEVESGGDSGLGSGGENEVGVVGVGMVRDFSDTSDRSTASSSSSASSGGSCGVGMIRNGSESSVSSSGSGNSSPRTTAADAKATTSAAPEAAAAAATPAPDTDPSDAHLVFNTVVAPAPSPPAPTPSPPAETPPLLSPPEPACPLTLSDPGSASAPSIGSSDAHGRCHPGEGSSGPSRLLFLRRLGHKLATAVRLAHLRGSMAHLRTHLITILRCTIATIIHLIEFLLTILFLSDHPSTGIRSALSFGRLRRQDQQKLPRSFAVTEGIEMARVTRVRRVLGATVNDLMMAIIASGIESHLQEGRLETAQHHKSSKHGAVRFRAVTMADLRSRTRKGPPEWGNKLGINVISLPISLQPPPPAPTPIITPATSASQPLGHVSIDIMPGATVAAAAVTASAGEGTSTAGLQEGNGVGMDVKGEAMARGRVGKWRREEEWAGEGVRRVRGVKAACEQKKVSWEAFLTNLYARTALALFGRKVMAWLFARVSQQTSITVSNIAGPREELVLSEHRVSSLVITTVGQHQAMTCHIESYAGHIRIVVSALAKHIPDVSRLCSHFAKAFDNLEKELKCSA